MQALSRIGVHHMLGLRAAALPCRLAPHLALVVCDAPDASLAALGGGRALQRMWLAATAEGLALQPVAAAIALSRQRAGNGWVSPRTRDRLVELLGHLTGGRHESACMLVRIGRARAPSMVTGRPPIEHFLDRDDAITAA
jgi:hypothetical protein